MVVHNTAGGMQELLKEMFSCSVTKIHLMSSLDKLLTWTNTDTLTELLQALCGLRD